MKLLTATACVAALYLSACIFGRNVSLRLLLLFASVVLVLFVVLRERDALQRLPPVWLAFGLWGAWAAASLFWSIDAALSLKELRNEVGYTALSLWVCFVAAQARRAASLFLPLLGVAAALACALALRDFTRGWDEYAAGWHGGPGYHSSALLTLMPGALMVAWYASRSGAPRWVAAAGLSLAALFFVSAYTTLNRTVWAGFAVELTVLGALLVLRGPRGAPSRRAKLVVLTGAIALTAACASMVLQVQATRENLGFARSFEADSRFALWPEIFARIAERPVTGYGFGRNLLRESLQEKFGTLDPFLWHAHNIFLDTALQVGLIGLGLLLLLLAAIVRAAWRLARDADEWAAACGMALLAVVAGMLVRNMTDTLFTRQNSLLFWGMTGLLLALGSRRRT